MIRSISRRGYRFVGEVTVVDAAPGRSTAPAGAREGEGAEGKLFGSVTSADIAEAVKAQTEIDIDRKAIDSDSIKTVGEHTVTASLHSDVSFPITLDVVPAE